MPAFPPPNPNDRLRDLIDGRYTTEAKWKWKSEYDDIVMGDLMRLTGWMKKDPGSGKENPAVSNTLKKLTAQDFQSLAKILEDHNGMTYGHSVYFCCSCT
jgi:hypothetical protein